MIINSKLFQNNAFRTQDTELYWFFLTNHDEFQEIVAKFSGASELLDIELYLVPSIKLLDQVEEELDCRDWIVIE